MILRYHQSAKVDGLRKEFAKGHKAIIAQDPTGSGKTVIIGSIINSLTERETPSIFIVPRKELIDQGSAHLTKWGVPHNFIHGKRTYNPVFLTHIASLQTSKKRWIEIIEKLKKKKKRVFFILDEAHTNWDWQVWFKSAVDDSGLEASYIGFTATPERFDGKGLHTSTGGIWDSIVYGLSIPELTRRGWLSPLEYYALTIDGIDEIKRSGTEYSQKETEELFKNKGDKIYGDIIAHYEKYAIIKKQTISTTSAVTRSGQYGNKTAVFFCRSVHLADELAQKLRLKGHNFQVLYGSMKAAERKAIIEALKKGEIDGVTSRDLITYGFDCPRIEYMGITRATMSRPLAFQIWGRGTRPFTLYRCCSKLYDNRLSCPSCGGPGVIVYRKEYCHVSDHVGLNKKIEDPEYPGVPGPWLEHIDWNFMGSHKKPKDVKPKIIARQCPDRGGYICTLPSCNGCEYYEGSAGTSHRAPEEVAIELKRLENARGFEAVPLEEHREVREAITVNVAAWSAAQEDKTLDSDKPVKELLAVAKRLNYKIMWVYNLLSEGMKAVNYPVLSAIQRINGYKSGWIVYQGKIIERRK